MALTNRLFGRYEMNIDAKGRLFFPAKQREKIEGNSLYITRGMEDECLLIFTESQLETFLDRMSNLPTMRGREAELHFLGNCNQVDLDEQGRIKVPSRLRDEVGLTKEVTLVGLREWMELWDSTAWEVRNKKLSSGQIASLLEDMNF